jgi:hypothetical protein
MHTYRTTQARHARVRRHQRNVLLQEADFQVADKTYHPWLPTHMLDTNAETWHGGSASTHSALQPREQAARHGDAHAIDATPAGADGIATSGQGRRVDATRAATHAHRDGVLDTHVAACVGAEHRSWGTATGPALVHIDGVHAHDDGWSIAVPRHTDSTQMHEHVHVQMQAQGTGGVTAAAPEATGGNVVDDAPEAAPVLAQTHGRTMLAAQQRDGVADDAAALTASARGCLDSALSDISDGHTLAVASLAPSQADGKHRDHDHDDNDDDDGMHMARQHASMRAGAVHRIEAHDEAASCACAGEPGTREAACAGDAAQPVRDEPVGTLHDTTPTMAPRRPSGECGGDALLQRHGHAAT